MSFLSAAERKFPQSAPEPVRWPQLWPLVYPMIPFIVLLLLAFWPAFKNLVNEYPRWTALFGVVFLLGWFGRYGGVLAHGLDFWLRTFDFVLNRTYGPDVEGYGPTGRLWYRLTRGGLLDGYSLPIVLWALVTLFTVVFGPTRTPLNDIGYLNDVPKLMRGPSAREVAEGWGLALGLLAAGGVAILMLWGLASLAVMSLTWRKFPLQPIMSAVVFGSVLLVSAILLVEWVFAEPGQVIAQADHKIYPHIFLLFIGVAALFAYLARFLARGLLDNFKRDYGWQWSRPELLRRAELFVPLPRLEDANREVGTWSSFWQNLRSAVTTPLLHPHLLLFPIAVVVLLGPSEYMHFSAVAAGLLAWSVLGLAGTHARLNNVLNWMQRLFFDGVLWVVSLLVIVLAACRIADVSYVATITNSASSMTLVWFLVSIYVVLWYYKYWIGYALSEELLGLLRNGQPPDRPLIYPVDEKHRDNKSVIGEGRCLQTHGTRLVAVGTFNSHDDQGRFKHGQAWEFYDLFALFEAIARKQPGTARPVGSVPVCAPGHPEVICKADDPEETDRKFGLSDLRQRIQFYHVVCDAAILGVVILFFVLERYYTLPQPELRQTSKQATFTLADDLFQSPDEMAGKIKPRPVILVAASGGGTRAALYSAAVLRGLHDQRALPDVKLLSGVSGGSAAIAHFVIHRVDLQKPERPPQASKDGKALDDPWTQYAETLSAPFIDDVLCGTLEIRVALGTRMGMLLDESLHRNIYRPPDGSPTKTSLAQGMTLADCRDTGLIFNSTMAGSEKKDGKDANPLQAGSRLIVTNIRTDEKTFPPQGEPYKGLENEYLHYVVVDEPTARLTTGAALSANFPPVFSNAAVDVELNGLDRYWVTDGGAAENRGAISLLYVLSQALKNELDKEDKTTRRKPRPIQIVIAEASGVSLDFSQDRGVSSMLGAPEKFATQLGLDLVEKVKGQCVRLGGDEPAVRFLPMPLVLRSRGGVGTHWKLPAFVRIADPTNKDNTVLLSDKQTRELIMDLYVPHKTPRAPEEEALLDTAWNWVEYVDERRGYGVHRENWKQLTKDFATLYGK